MTSHDYYSMRASLRETERELGIEVPQIVHGERDKSTALSDRDLNAKRMATRKKLQPNFIDPAVLNSFAAQAKTPDEYIQLAAKSGYAVQVARSANGKATGLLYQARGAETWLSGSSIDRSLTLPNVQSAIDGNAARAHSASTPQKSLAQQRPTSQPTAPRQRG